MRIVTFDGGEGPQAGFLVEGDTSIVDFASLGPDAPTSVLGWLDADPARRRELADAARRASGVRRRAAASVRLLAPIPTPRRNIICVGRNYHEHIREMHGSPPPKDSAGEHAVIFTKAPSCIIGPGAPVPGYLDYSQSLDYEGELAVVIGKAGRGVAKSDALAHVFGYTIFNDVTARTIQRQHSQWFLGKSIDGFGPMGPCIVTADEIPDPTRLRVRTLVNGEVRQDESVANMIFDIPTIIATVSRTMRLEPGDIIATGTPSGVGQGFKPPKYMKTGDEVAVVIEPIGELRNTIE